MRLLAAFALALLAACGGGGGGSHPGSTPMPPGSEASKWTIGPIIGGKNYSKNMPLHPSPCAEGIFCFDFPLTGEGSVHYVTYHNGSLAGKQRIIFRFTIETDPGVHILPTDYPEKNSILVVYIQQAGDDWSGNGKYAYYRWYGGFNRIEPIIGGQYEIIAPLDANWGSVNGQGAWTNNPAFQAALANADEIGFVMGHSSGYGHGVEATGHARMIVTSFEIQ